jgi:hypothetical protein
MSGFNFFGKPPAQQSAGDTNQNSASVKLDELLTFVKSAVGSMQTQVDSLGSRIDQVVSEFGGRKVEPPTKPEDEPQVSKLQSMSDEELEQLSRKELLALQQQELTNVVTGAMKDLLTPVQERLNGMEQTTYQTKAQTEFEKFVNAAVDGKPKYPDWKDYFSSMKDILSKTKGISIFDAYTMAKARLKESDPNKFTEIEEKHFPKNPASPVFSYGGQQTVSHSAPTKETNMSLDDAMEATAREFQELHGPMPDLN